MANYLLVYTGGGMPEGEEMQAAVMAAWGAWYAGLESAVVDPGNPVGAPKSVTDQGVSDEPISSPPATGYSIISADSMDDAVTKVQAHPHLTYGGQVSVYETFPM